MKGKACFAAFVLLLVMVPSASAESSRELVENFENFNGTIVTFRGEVVGVLMRGDFAWINVLDNGIAIGVWCRASDAKKISTIGDYTHIGDIVEVVGVFHSVCAEHGGDLDIHAENFRVVNTGETIPRAPDLLLVSLSAVFVAVAIFTVYWLRRIRKERSEITPWPMPWA